MPSLAITLMLSLPASATGWTGRQTTIPVDRPADEEPAAPPAAAPGAGLDRSASGTEARWGLSETPIVASPLKTTDAVETGTEMAPPSPPAAAPSGPEDVPAGPLPGPINRATDYTAYALEFGEVRLGLAEFGLGVAPRVQLATTPLLYALGAWNIKTKANVIRVGAWDMALVGNVNGLTEGRDFQAIWTRVGMLHSVRVGERIGIHAGGGWDHIFAMGLPSREALRPFVWSQERREAYDTWYDTAVRSDARLEANQNLLTLRCALDVRFTHRDALVVQASGIAWGDARSG
ncbi:MAG: hypothetical protein VX265_14910, partial [Myxococcota bacterium]|nr:hypothetical protein [Myxococcota bacterium]